MGHLPDGVQIRHKRVKTIVLHPGRHKTAYMVKRFFTFGALGIAALLMSLPQPAGAVSDRRIEDARYACDSFIDGLAENSRRKDTRRAEVARFWLFSFLTGAYEADEVLEFAEDGDSASATIVSQVTDYCAQNGDFSIHAAAVNTGTFPKPLPPTPGMGFDPRAYSCAAYMDGRDSRGDDRDQAETAEFWAFAFVQGNVSARYHPRLVISVSDKRKIVRALEKSCARNPSRTLLDQTSEIASRVRPEVLNRR